MVSDRSFYNFNMFNVQVVHLGHQWVPNRNKSSYKSPFVVHKRAAIKELKSLSYRRVYLSAASAWFYLRSLWTNFLLIASGESKIASILRACFVSPRQVLRHAKRRNLLWFLEIAADSQWRVLSDMIAICESLGAFLCTIWSRLRFQLPSYVYCLYCWRHTRPFRFRRSL